MLSIQTRYHGPTNTKGSRITASVTESRPKRRQVTVHYDHALNADTNHLFAARELARKLGWSGRWHMGSTDTGYIFVRQSGFTGDFFQVGE